MSYIAFDLDALNVARDVGAAAGVPEERVTHGLLRMWAWCFREKTEHIDAVQVRGFFGSDAAPALVSFGFLAADGEVFRVRGAQRYLRVAEARRRGAEKTNAAKRERGVSDAPSTLERRSSDAQATLNRALPSALTPNTEHRAPNTEHQKEEAPPPPQPIVAVFELKRPDLETIDAWVKEDFWRAAEITRREAGFPPEKWPNPVALSRWWGEAQQVADTRALADAFVRFIADKHWRAASPPCPWAAFAKQYLNFIPSRGVA